MMNPLKSVWKRNLHGGFSGQDTALRRGGAWALGLVLMLACSGRAVAQTKAEVDQAVSIIRQAINKSSSGISTTPAKLITEISDADLESLLREMGHADFSVQDRDARRTIYAVKMGARTVVLGNFRTGRDLQVYIIFGAADGVTPEKLQKLNDWNRDKRYARAYLGKDGTWTLTSDLDLQHGISRDAVKGFVRLFGVMVNDYVDFLKKK